MNNTTTDNNDNTTAITAAATTNTATTNKSNNISDNYNMAIKVLVIIITKMKSGCTLSIN